MTFRKDTKWVAAVAGKVKTPWGEVKSPRFQSHAVSISQDKNGNFISEDEAHFICAVLNSKIVGSYVTNSSDSRSFKVRPQINIPKYEPKNVVHLELSKLSKKAHKKYDDEKIIEGIDKRLNELVVKL